jgi:hypothetical protein
MFPKNYANFANEIVEDQVVGINGRLDNRRGMCQVACDNAKILSLETMINNAKEQGSYNPEDKSDIAIRLLDDIWADVEAEVAHQKATEPYLIKIPEKLPQEKMQALKDLLQNNQGDIPVELFLGGVNKKIKLPFGVNLTDALKQNVDSILG